MGRGKNTDTNYMATAPLEHIMELEYKKYKSVCYWTYEKVTPYGKWLAEIIDVQN